MSAASRRAFFLMMAAATAAGGGGGPVDPGDGCAPFPRIDPATAALSVSADIVPINPAGDSLHVCREIT